MNHENLCNCDEKESPLFSDGGYFEGSITVWTLPTSAPGEVVRVCPHSRRIQNELGTYFDIPFELLDTMISATNKLDELEQFQRSIERRRQELTHAAVHS